MRLPRLAGLSVVLVAANLTVAIAGSSNPPIPCEAIDSVGTAKMSADGTITLRVHSLWPQPFAERQLIYAPDNALYGEIKRHLGGMTPGEIKPVPPMCGTNSEP
jgi:hypothetical protein